MNTFDHISIWTMFFVGLKITGYITLGWFWVLSPIWITILIILVMSVSGYRTLKSLSKKAPKIPGKKA